MLRSRHHLEATSHSCALSRTERSWRRAAWLTIAVLAAGVLGLAAWLVPAPAGHGTHTQLGLPPCSFLLATGIRCPGCGLTTAFAHAVRGDFGDAWSSHAGGVLLFALTVLSIPMSLWAARWALPLPILWTHWRLHWPLLAVVGLTALLWWVRT